MESVLLLTTTALATKHLFVFKPIHQIKNKVLNISYQHTLNYNNAMYMLVWTFVKKICTVGWV